jgi:hypothetical protein
VITLDKVCNASAHLDNDTRSLMSHDKWSGMRPFTLLQMQIAMAHTRAGDLDLHFAWAGWGEVNVENLDGLIG